MTVKIYRYRKIESALAEIENGTFYFASREELNDPIEGYVKLCFQGDKFAWEGLLRNYICSLFVSIERFLVISPTIDYENKSIEKILKNLRSTTVIVDIHRFDNVPIGKKLKNVATTFLNDSSVQKLIEIYGNRNEKSSSKEIQLILRAVHYTAFNICLRHFKSNGLLLNVPEIPSSPAFPFESIQSISQDELRLSINLAEDTCNDFMEEMYFVTKLRQDNIATNEQITSDHKQNMTWATLMVNFPKIYVAQLQNVIYPDAYIVCFSETPTNSAMWGNYAQNHQGICFIYETQEINGKNYLPVDSNKMEVKRVKYDDDVIERNFFTTFGRLTMDSFSKDNVDSWREKYWQDYIDKFHRKNTAWAHEQEYRILLPEKPYQHTQKETRFLQYDSNSLKGVIFGIDTSVDDKFALIQAIKMVGDKFKSVKFFQAEYEENTQKIIIREKFYIANKGVCTI